jgi:parallel beta-helix repeat protein
MNKKMNSWDIKMGRIARHVKIALLIATLCFSIGLVTAIPQQDYTLYGTATLNGKILTAQDNAIVSLKVDGIELVSYRMRDISGTDNYALKVPMDSDPSVTTAAQEGDTAYIYINGIAINEGTQIIGAPGTTVQFAISATSADNPPSVTVRYPNGGESIPIGTQVEVSAHAIDDAAVTGVTFYYSSDGGSNGNLIGAGTRVSGTDKDGLWNKNWNTNGLNAGTNYVIKAVASDGTLTGEDQSDSTFSLTCTPPSSPTLNDPGTTDTDGDYTVSWSSVRGATSYRLEEDTSSSFSSPTVVHSGADTSKYITGKSTGTYYYRVKVCNACGCSGWSNEEDIVVSHEGAAPSVTVVYPNGGESISIGTQVQVSAHATDDNAVTGVTFYYSRDGGSNWNLVGEGAKVSGTDKEGIWNRTWDTKGLSAGTNYMIKAIASDGTSTSEDQSEGTFSLTPSKVIRVPDDYPTIQAAIDAASSGYIINVSSGTYFEHLVIDKPLKLIGEDKNTTLINGSGSGSCVHITADNVEISGFTIKNGVRGIYLESSNGSIMDNNMISDHCVGISLSDSNNNLITHNSLHNNVCYISGIQLSSSHNNVIRDNDLVENGGGVSLYDSNNNLIYHNNFVDNTKRQAFDDTGTNSWDNGSSVGGNYWSNHTCTGNPSDGSQPYSIASNSIDHYPFQKQSGWVKDNQPAIPDSAGAISVTSSPSCANIGLDGVPINALTAYTLTNVPAGTHTIKLTLEDYHDWSTSVHVIAGTTSSVHATLTPISTQIEMKPDLLISSITGIGVVGEPLTIYYTITNRGNAVAQQSYSGLYIDGKYIKKDYVDTLAPGATINQKSFDYIWDCTAGDQATIQVCADISHQVAESNEMNNCKSDFWTCPS